MTCGTPRVLHTACALHSIERRSRLTRRALDRRRHAENCSAWLSRSTRKELYVLERRVSDNVMSRKKQRDDKVIHVVFGPGGGRVERRDAQAVDAAAEPQSGREPLTDLFSGTEIARLLDVTPARLRTLDRAGVVSPTGRRKGRRAYTFSDLIALRTAQTLLSQRVRLRDVTRAVSALKRTLPKVTRPLQELRIVSDGQRVVVHTQDGAFEP